MAQQPNLYQLSGDGITVTYSTTSFIGHPTFTYNDGTINKTFTGSEINVTSVPILGTLVSVNDPCFGSAVSGGTPCAVTPMSGAHWILNNPTAAPRNAIGV